MSQLNDDEKRRLFQTLDLHTQQNDETNRGLYGDKKNGVKGALERLDKIETWIENHNLKTAYVSGSVAAGILFLKIGWDWLTKMKK